MDNDLMLALIVSVPVFILIGVTLYDIARRKDLDGVRKLGWLAVVVLLPAVGTLLYLIARPLSDPGEEVDDEGDRIGELVKVLRRRERGELDDDAFATAKAELFGRSGGG